MNSKKKVTLKVIAEKAEVDVSTVSRALNNSSKISDPVKKKIWALARKLEYAPNLFARGLATSRSFSVCLVVPDFNFMFGPFFQEILRGIEIELDRRDYSLQFAKLSRDSRNGFFQIVNGGGIDGALILGDTVGDEWFPALARVPVPIIVINRANQETEKDYVMTNNVHGGELAGEHLLSHQYQNMIYLGGDKNFQVNRERQKGFDRALKSAGFSLKDVQYYYGPFSRGLQYGYQIMKSVNLVNGNTGIFAASDTIALGAMKYMIDNNIAVGKDIGIIGYDDLDIDAFQSVSLTSVNQNGRDIGENSCRLLLDRIEGKDTEPYVKLEPVLSIRESCGCFFSQKMG